jgi:hypothetical protein
MEAYGFYKMEKKVKGSKKVVKKRVEEEKKWGKKVKRVEKRIWERSYFYSLVIKHQKGAI